MSFTVCEIATSVVRSGRIRRYAGTWMVRTGMAWLRCAPELAAELGALHTAGAIAVDDDGFADPGTRERQGGTAWPRQPQASGV